MSFDISESSTITIENINQADSVSFIGGFDTEDERFGYDEKYTIYGVIKSKYSTLISKGNVSIEVIDEDNKSTLKEYFKNQTRFNIIDQDESTHNGLKILGKSLKFTKVYEIEGIPFYKTSFEVGR
jgi:hypothetical protein